MAVVNEAQMSSAVEPGLKKVFAGNLNQDPDMSLIGVLYDTMTSDMANEDFLEIEDIGNVPEFTGDLHYTEFKQGRSKTVTPTEYALGLKVQRKYFDDDLYGVVESMVAQMGQVCRYLMEEQAASPFVNAFGTGVFTTFDSAALCSDSHSYASTSTTQDNAGSAAFAYAALDATLSLMRRYKNSQDRLILRGKPDTLLGPVELETPFTEVIQSELKAGSANNDINVFNRKFKIITTPFLADTNNWFLIDSRMMKEFMKWIMRVRPEFNRTTDFNTLVKCWSVYVRFAVQPLNWQHIYGHSVS
jgi:phage major head subunit gpT-like protein